MASGADPDRGTFDFTGGPVEEPDLADALAERIDGDVRFDAYSRGLYATDASIYEVTPVGVVFPESTADVASVVDHCASEDVPVLPRGGGTSLAGQAVNAAVVLDFSRHMDDVLAVDPDAQTARVQPGAILADLNQQCAPHDLKFAPDPAWGDKSAIGGAIGNNSTGAHSLQYGKTDAYLRELEVVLADGTVTTLGTVTRDELDARADPDGDVEARLYAAVADILDEHGDAIAERYPDLKRNVSGYNLAALVAEGDDINLAQLIAGSEGTLAVVTEAVVDLVAVPETKAMALLGYETLGDAMADVAPILDHDPAAVEVLDDVLLDLARDTEQFRDVVGLVPDGADAVLLVEFYAADDRAGKRKVAQLLADRSPESGTSVGLPVDRITADAPQRAVGAREAHEDAERERFWKLRKSGLPILLSRTTDAKHIAFVEDTAVPPENLPEYVADVQAVLDEHDTYASFYAHAGPGVLHIRPLVNTKTEHGVAEMEAIADAMTDLVVAYGGSVSGEHGDGRARSQWNEKLYGTDLYAVFRDLKTAADPDWLLNPGQVCGATEAAIDAGDAPERARIADMAEHLRMGPDYDFEAGFEPTLDWDIDNGLQGMVELCHGCGGCRGGQDTTGGVMCPTYRAVEEESLATRGRANALRQAMSGDLPAGTLFSEEFRTEILDLCIGCKGCAHDCPSEVDMAKLKAELTHEHHQREGASWREKLFANFDRVARWGSATAPVSNWLAGLPGSDWLSERVLGIAPERDLPRFQRETVKAWAANRDPAVTAGAAEHRVVLFVDTDTNYSHPDVGKAAVRVLEAAGAHVRVADHTDSGRAAHSTGMLDVARERATTVVDAVAPRIQDGWDLVAVEPSDAVMFQSDYLDLLDSDAVTTVAANAYGVCEYLDTRRLVRGLQLDAPDTPLTYHGHCHQKATGKDHHAVGVLRRAGYTVDALDSGCCGMAGSFGYETDHYGLSRAIGEILEGQIADSSGERVVAPGVSCRTQLAGDGRPPHPVEALADALTQG
jgi:FAD/FMN-containing dehydrogenase/Fe-S oxidoreductase